MSKINIYADIPWYFCQTENRNWIAECEPLGLTVQSASYSDLVEDIGDTLNLLFRDLLGTHELDEFLRAHNWTRGDALPEIPEEAEFDVPFELMGKHDFARAVRQ